MKELKEYIYESQEEDLYIDESLKQWIKRAASTAAIATVLIGSTFGANNDVKTYNDNNGNKVEQVSSDEIKDIDSSELHTIRSKPALNSNMANQLKNTAIQELQNNNSNIKILQVKKLQSKSTGKICYEISYTIN